MKGIRTLLFLLLIAAVSCKKESLATGANSLVNPADSVSELYVCTFNIQFLGNSTKRDNEALVNLICDYDIVVVQELVSPPYAGLFPNGTPFKPDAEAAAFFDLMQAAGFSYILSEEDTGTGDNINRNGSSTEWWVVFYKANKVALAPDLPQGFLADDRSNHPSYERVPYCFSFRTINNCLDFSLISVHLKPGDGSANQARRAEELAAIYTWIAANDSLEQDFFVLGDMNFKDAAEITEQTPHGITALNNEATATNTNVNGSKPYDNIFYNSTASKTELDSLYDIHIINLLEEMKPYWDTTLGVYPGEPYNHNIFRQYYSDHHPVVFHLLVGEDDD